MEFLRLLAAPFAPLYRAVVAARNRRYDQRPQWARKAKLPVISVGNLTTGGTGKTPLTLFLAESLQKDGYPNAVLSRGYGGRRDIDPMLVQPDSDPRQSGDEPLMMARRLGANRVYAARNRHAGALRAQSELPYLELLILDDGFQHRQLHRDLDLLLLDGVRRWGNGKMLPLGDLREPLENARRAHALVVTRASCVMDRSLIEGWWRSVQPEAPIFWVDFFIQRLRRWDTGEHLDLPESSPPASWAWCALGHPQAFFADLLVAGVPWEETRAYADHATLSLRRFLLLQERASKAGAQRLICTEKDAVKLTVGHQLLAKLPLYVAEQSVRGGEDLLSWIAGRISELEREEVGEC